MQAADKEIRGCIENSLKGKSEYGRMYMIIQVQKTGL